MGSVRWRPLKFFTSTHGTNGALFSQYQGRSQTRAHDRARAVTEGFQEEAMFECSPRGCIGILKAERNYLAHLTDEYRHVGSAVTCARTQKKKLHHYPIVMVRNI
uniref:Uncharacterized protein n=1 Tax=Molossus molossus TaxID=27622 RepID=A0A7J8JX00_MOLMO|nr:hypothetical protein HJG59_008031 [Molossus molossus]